MKNGFYGRLESELQGLGNTYYVGGLMAFELTERNSSYAMALICKHFATTDPTPPFPYVRVSQFFRICIMRYSVYPHLTGIHFFSITHSLHLLLELPIFFVNSIRLSFVSYPCSPSIFALFLSYSAEFVPSESGSRQEASQNTG